jgi:hypothetical protein
MAMRISQFLAILVTAIALIPGGAHVLTLPAKMAMPQEPYFIAQQVYQGWAWLGIATFVAIFANFASALLTRHHSRQLLLSLTASLLIAATLIVFFVWTYPANQATVNWTSVPDDWERLRIQWEYSHAANAALTFVALLCSIGAALSAPQTTATTPVATGPSAHLHA